MAGVARARVGGILPRVLARRGRVVGPFRLPTEHLPSQLGNLGVERFNLPGLLSDLSVLVNLLLTQLSDLGAQFADRALQVSNIGFRICRTLGRARMLRTPEVRLLTQINPFQTVGVFRNARHATMVGERGHCVQQPRVNFLRPPSWHR